MNKIVMLITLLCFTSSQVFAFYDYDREIEETLDRIEEVDAELLEMKAQELKEEVSEGKKNKKMLKAFKKEEQRIAKKINSELDEQLYFAKKITRLGRLNDKAIKHLKKVLKRKRLIRKIAVKSKTNELEIRQKIASEIKRLEAGDSITRFKDEVKTAGGYKAYIKLIIETLEQKVSKFVSKSAARSVANEYDAKLAYLVIIAPAFALAAIVLFVIAIATVASGGTALPLFIIAGALSLAVIIPTTILLGEGLIING